MELSIVDFAKLAGVSASAVSQKVKSGNLVRNSARKLDTENAVNALYLKKRRATNKKNFVVRELESAAVYGVGDDDGGAEFFVPADGEEYITVKVLNSIRKIRDEFKTAKDVDDWIAREKNLVLIHEKQQKINERAGSLIERKFVESDVFTYLETVKSSLEDWSESNIDNLIATIDAAKPEARRAAGLEYCRRSMAKVLENSVEHTVAIISGYEKKESGREKLLEVVNEIKEAGSDDN